MKMRWDKYYKTITTDFKEINEHFTDEKYMDSFLRKTTKIDTLLTNYALLEVTEEYSTFIYEELEYLLPYYNDYLLRLYILKDEITKSFETTVNEIALGEDYNLTSAINPEIIADIFEYLYDIQIILQEIIDRACTVRFKFLNYIEKYTDLYETILSTKLPDNLLNLKFEDEIIYTTDLNIYIKKGDNYYE